MSEMDPAVRAAVLRQEQQRMADPRIAHHVERIEAGERLKEAEADRRIAEAEAARAEVEAQKQRALDKWMAEGNDPDDFGPVWTKLRAELFVEQQARERQQRRSSSVF